MKVVILAGGLGTRISEETALRPKPMVEIGGRPIIWHIMKIYSHFGHHDFVICLGYRGYMIKEYFANYFLHMSDVTIHIAENRMDVHRKTAEPWRVTLVDTGAETMIGGRIKRILPYIGPNEAFCLTYGDGVANIDLKALLALHEREGRLATVTATRPPSRFGVIEADGYQVLGFREKPAGGESWINVGFFVLHPRVGDYIEGDATVFEREPLENLAKDGQLSVYHHEGFWHPMDTLRDKNLLEDLWRSGSAPWKMW
jgi:glucose-1-phosphate cytidylyltransferase